jgi:hypothetical protein
MGRSKSLPEKKRTQQPSPALGSTVEGVGSAANAGVATSSRTMSERIGMAWAGQHSCRERRVRGLIY